MFLYELYAWVGCWSMVFISMATYNVCNLLSFENRVVAGSGQFVTVHRLVIPIGWLLVLQLTDLSWRKFVE